ncbi:hypothetical protein GCM10010387_57870 [Streptomyces inusitatus]|uniref:Uncharacterized protein n=1 Tax=Streptomyces inusitatus TaxID=68221 RepID=A0A918QM92_9ACTN|nr:hypothetical protein [Streptomyces inusitatus]GGZ56285.1 hypothetical protein GCM10010387_57870 [Streptomyces inusitatus]
MIRSDSVNTVARQGALGPFARTAAARRGRRDGARGVPRVPLAAAGAAPPGIGTGTGTGIGAVPVPLAVLPDTDPVLLTPYVTVVRQTARRATEQLRATLIRREHGLLTRLRAESVRVVTQYDVRLDPMPAALARYGHWVGQWRTSTDVCRSRAQAVVDRSNQQLACYWEGLCASHQQLSRLGRGPGPDWLPGRMELDESWRRPETWLLDDDADAGTATSRALRILDRQNSGSAGGRTAR